MTPLPKFHGGTKLTRSLNRGARKPEASHTPYHAGSGLPKTLHAPPRRGGGINDQNYAGHKVKRK